METKKSNPKKTRTDAGQQITPVKVETALVSGIQPKVVKLHNLRTGHIIDMSFKAASSLAAKFPKEYKLA